jgi:hypothetical protein
MYVGGFFSREKLQGVENLLLTEHLQSCIGSLVLRDKLGNVKKLYMVGG